MVEGDYARHVTELLDKALNSFKIVNLIGPRQVGKTTLVRDLLQKGEYISLDDENILRAIEADPVEQLASLKEDADGEPVIIDEAQRSKKLALAIKAIVDSDRSKGQFIFTGSSNIFATMKVADALPGRVVPLELWPLTLSEIRRVNPSRLLDWALQKKPSLRQISRTELMDRDGLIDLILKGGFPEPRELPLRQRQNLYRSYVNSIVDRDVRDVSPIRKTDKFRKLIDQMAARTGQEVNRKALSNSLSVKWETVDSYLDIMHRLSLIIQLGAWTSGEAKREIKLPKFHFVDTGMNCALRRFDKNSFDLGSANAPQLGGLLESFVFNEIKRMLPFQSKEFRLYHWRSPDHREIDILAEGGGQLVGMEVKSSSAVSNDDFKHLKWFASDGPGKTRRFTGIVFYLGDRKLSFGDGCFALPVSTLWAPVEL